MLAGGIGSMSNARVSAQTLADVQASPTSPTNPFADPAFELRTDALVSTGKVKRSYYWGPRPLHGLEDYARGRTASTWSNTSTRAAWRSTTPTATRPTHSMSPTAYSRGANLRATCRPATTTTCTLSRRDCPGQRHRRHQRAHLRQLPGRNAPAEQPHGHGQATPWPTRSTASASSASDKLQHLQRQVSPTMSLPPSTTSPTVFWTFLNQSGPIIRRQDRNGAPQRPLLLRHGLPDSRAYWAASR